MNFSGLSLDQAPPISAPMRFFLTAPLFGIIAAVMLFFVDAEMVMNRYSSEAVVFVHIITLGLFSMVMLGALQQMLPVLAGVSLPKALYVAGSSHIALVLGLLAFIYGFIFADATVKFVAMFLLGLAFLILLTAISSALLRVKNFNATVRSISVSTIFATLVVLLGVHLLASHATNTLSEFHLRFVDVHAVLALFGFAGLLIIGVSFQVLPMFYVAPRFKSFCKKYVLWLIVSGLLSWSLFYALYPPAVLVGKVVIVLFFSAFGVTVLKKLKERRRPVKDVTIWYWKTAAISLVVGLGVWVVNDFLATDLIPFVALFIGGGFILSLITGMLYKIVPFLVWFHLNAMGYMQMPTMKEMLSERVMKLQYFMYLLALIGGGGSYLFSPLLDLAALALLCSFILLEYNLLQAVRVYWQTKKRAPDFAMPDALEV